MLVADKSGRTRQLSLCVKKASVVRRLGLARLFAIRRKLLMFCTKNLAYLGKISEQNKKMGIDIAHLR